ncbi:MAG: T9SS type A sorting domain-containing protein [Melioribacteraceae bacterium]|nr:T9SS type A sorting domain-containing protein [Melioribacteraceae bacterium]
MKKIFFLFLFAELIIAQQLAFPGAEGFGKYTTGGRGGIVYEVTNLNDSGPGSLRDALSKTGPITIIFRVSGTIELKSPLKVTKPNVTIAGQTAPGDGICLSNYTFSVQANNVIIRYLRFRLGDLTKYENDAANGMGYYKNIILDHCSFSWSIDECASFYNNENFTMQWCLISESLYNSFHSKGAHGYGGIWGGKNATFHHNLLAHHSSRNPRFAGGETPVCENVDFRNNVIYNWGSNSAYGGEAGKINIVANYYKFGPATKSGVKYRIIDISDTASAWFVKDNFVFDSPVISSDNWNGGVQGTQANFHKNNKKRSTPFPFEPINQQTAEEAYNLVLQNAGCVLPKRDPIDERIISEVKNGTSTYGGIWGAGKGIIDSQKEVGGWPILNSTNPPIDNDKDGMADSWEISKGLNPNNPDDRNLVDSSGYTMLELYLNGIVDGTVVSVENNNQLPIDFKLFQNFPNPFNPTTNIKYEIPHIDINGEKTNQKVKLSIYDTLGNEVAILVNEIQKPGFYNYSFSSKHYSLSSGVYFYKLQIGKYSEVKKMILMK